VTKFDKRHFYPVILAGGRGTRFWPLSRKRLAKQLLPLNSRQTMIQETVARLAPVSLPANFWIISNQDLRKNIIRQLPQLPPRQVIAEPLGRNTAPAIGLAAFLLRHRHVSLRPRHRRPAPLPARSGGGSGNRGGG
jgi:mannose-1-phosphate guanylyltransferase